MGVVGISTEMKLDLKLSHAKFCRPNTVLRADGTDHTRALVLTSVKHVTNPAHTIVCDATSNMLHYPN